VLSDSVNKRGEKAMAKRLTDTDKWKRPWWRKLDSKAKILWIYLLDNCDHAGIWIEDYDLASYQLGFSVDVKLLISSFGDKVRRIDSDKLFIEGFIEFQYNCDVSGLKPGNNAHASVLKILNKYGACKPLMSPCLGALDKDKDKDKDNIRESEGVKKKAHESVMPEIAKLWNDHADPRLPKVLAMSKKSKRYKACVERYQENSNDEFWVSVIKQINSNSFLTGQNDRGWKANIEFLTRPDAAQKILEGFYKNDSKQLSTGGW
jgi:hypothetical protein